MIFENENLLSQMEAYAEVNHVPIINAKARRVFTDIIKGAKPKRLLEIGTAIGYSGLLALMQLENDARLCTIEQNALRAETARNFFAESSYRDRIVLLEGDAGEIIKNLDEEFDFVFIDAAKGQYPDYWRKIQHLLSPDCIVLADNVLFRGYVLGNEIAPRRFRTITKRLREYLDMVKADCSFETVIYEDGDGLAVSKRRKNFA